MKVILKGKTYKVYGLIHVPAKSSNLTLYFTSWGQQVFYTKFYNDDRHYIILSDKTLLYKNVNYGWQHFGKSEIPHCLISDIVFQIFEEHSNEIESLHNDNNI